MVVPNGPLRYLFAPLVAACLILVCCKRSATPNDVALDISKALTDADSAAMSKFVADVELTRLDISSEQAAMFFEKELFEKWNVVGSPIIEEDSYHTVAVRASLVSKSKDQDSELHLVALPGDNGIETPDMFKVVIWNNALAIARREGRATDPGSRHRIVAEYIRKNGERFRSSYGLKGLYFVDDGVVVEWENISERYREWADRIDERKAASEAR